MGFHSSGAPRWSPACANLSKSGASLSVGSRGARLALTNFFRANSSF
jgi:hypothetical protein